MRTYKVSELAVGIVYKCRLSGAHMLIERVVTQWTETMSGKSPKQSEIMALYFNPVTGSYVHMTPVDDQLIEIE